MITRRGLFGIIGGALAAGFAPIAELVRPKQKWVRYDCSLMVESCEILSSDGNAVQVLFRYRPVMNKIEWEQ